MLAVTYRFSDRIAIDIGEMIEDVEEWRLRVQTEDGRVFWNGFSTEAEGVGAIDVEIGVELSSPVSAGLELELMLRLHDEPPAYWLARGSGTDFRFEASSAFSGAPFQPTVEVLSVSSARQAAIVPQQWRRALAIPGYGVLQLEPDVGIQVVSPDGTQTHRHLAPTRQSYIHSLAACPTEAAVLWGEPVPSRKIHCSRIPIPTGKVRTHEIPITSWAPRVEYRGDVLTLHYVSEPHEAEQAIIERDGKLSRTKLETPTLFAKCISWKDKFGPGATIVEGGSHRHLIPDCALTNAQFEDGAEACAAMLTTNLALFVGQRIWFINMEKGVAHDHGPALENYGEILMVNDGKLWGPDGSSVALEPPS